MAANVCPGRTVFIVGHEIMACILSMPSASHFSPSRYPESSTPISSMSSNSNRGQCLTTAALRPQHLQRGGRRGGNTQQHGERVVTRGGASKSAPARLHQKAEAPTKGTYRARTEHTAVQNRAGTRGQETEGPRSHGRQKRRKEAGVGGVNVQRLAHPLHRQKMNQRPGAVA
jgi:hypothetical protein